MRHLRAIDCIISERRLMDMENAQLRSEKEITEIYERHVDMVYRICFSYLKNTMDTEDMVQNTFMKIFDSSITFDGPEHEKAWLIVTASNLCKNHLKHWWQKRGDLEDYHGAESQDFKGESELLDAVQRLPEKYRIVLYLYYYEGYDTNEIAKLLNKPSSTIRNDLHRGRKSLKEMIGEDLDEKQKIY